MTRNRIWLVMSVVAAGVLFVGTLIAVTAHWALLESADWAVLDPLYRYGSTHPGWAHGWDVFCTVFSPAVFRVIGLVWIVYAMVRRRFRVAIFLVLAVEVSGLVIVAAKAAVDRPRPATALAYATSSSFPSGHALGVMAAVTAMTIVALPPLRRAWRGLVLAAGIVIVVAVGVGRVVLNVHHPSDVLAGWALGYLWVAVCLPVLDVVTAADGTPAVLGTAP